MLKRMEVKEDYIRLHNCKSRRKGRNKGKPCKYLFSGEEAEMLIKQPREIDTRLRTEIPNICGGKSW
jgi:hypothetical protein